MDWYKKSWAASLWQSISPDIPKRPPATLAFELLPSLTNLFSKQVARNVFRDSNGQLLLRRLQVRIRKPDATVMHHRFKELTNCPGPLERPDGLRLLL